MKNSKKNNVAIKNEKESFGRRIMMFKDCFQDFYNSCPQDVKDKYNYNLNIVATSKGLIPVSIFKPIQGHKGLFELRVKGSQNLYRTFVTFEKDEMVVLYNSIIKKTQKTPRQALENAERLRKEYGGDVSKLTEFKLEDSAIVTEEDDDVLMAEKQLEDYQRGLGFVSEVDFIDFGTETKIPDSFKRRGLPKGLVYYAETRRYLEDSKIVSCEVYVQVCYESDLSYDVEVVDENGLTLELTEAEFVTRYEDEMEEWVTIFKRNMKLYHDIDCKVEYWY